MNRPIRTTIIFALASGMLIVAGAWLLHRVMPLAMAFKLTMWADLAVYAVLLARWSDTPLIRIVFPLAILLSVAVWPQTNVGFFLMATAMLIWVRSGICFQGAPLRALFAEIFCVAGAGALLALLGGSGYVGWVLNLSLFFLVQSLYFFIIPDRESNRGVEAMGDPFERAMAGAAKVLEER